MKLAELTEEFWAWRVATQPDSSDDITRVARPAGWVADWSADAVRGRQRAARAFAERYRALEVADAPIAVHVNHRLLGSALARVRWELDLLRAWQRNPCFYLDQSLVPLYNVLLEPRVPAEPVVRHLERVPVVLAQARENLAGHAAAPFARSAMHLLENAADQLRRAMAALVLPEQYRQRHAAATDTAARAITGYRDWLGKRLPSFTDDTGVGPAAFGYFLHRVALLPYPAQRLREMGRQEWDRAIAAEAVLRQRYVDAPAPALCADAAAQIARQHDDELRMRQFSIERGLLSQPDSLRHYRSAPMPDYLAPLSWLGVPHYAGSVDRRDGDAIRYILPPRADLPYFEAAQAYDPRTGIVHEGVHAQQLALSWAHPDPARRRYYDSAPNEGIAFYHEEMVLLAGLFDDAPASARFVANAMRLRALRVEIDVALALGELSLDGAADRLAHAVPLDRLTAWHEAVFFAGNPGQGLSYQIGKLQILDLLATCQRAEGDAFDLRAFHDRLWLEGNVPLVLQRWELLGLRDHLDTADDLAGTVPDPLP